MLITSINYTVGVYRIITDHKQTSTLNNPGMRVRKKFALQMHVYYATDANLFYNTDQQVC